MSMSGFTGKWKRVSSSNVDAVIKAVGGDAQQSAAMKTLFSDASVIEHYKVTDTGTHRELFVDGELKRVIDSTFNTPQVVDTVFGKSTLTTKLVSDSRIELTETPIGNRPGTFTVMSLVDGRLITDYTVSGVTCQRIYEKQ